LFNFPPEFIEKLEFQAWFNYKTYTMENWLSAAIDESERMLMKQMRKMVTDAQSDATPMEDLCLQVFVEKVFDIGFDSIVDDSFFQLISKLATFNDLSVPPEYTDSNKPSAPSSDIDQESLAKLNYKEAMTDMLQKGKDRFDAEWDKLEQELEEEAVAMPLWHERPCGDAEREAIVWDAFKDATASFWRAILKNIENMLTTPISENEEPAKGEYKHISSSWYTIFIVLLLLMVLDSICIFYYCFCTKQNNHNQRYQGYKI